MIYGSQFKGQTNPLSDKRSEKLTQHRACEGPTCRQESNYGEWKCIKIQPFGEGERERETNMTYDPHYFITLNKEYRLYVLEHMT
jgi:hypothetical protein